MVGRPLLYLTLLSSCPRPQRVSCWSLNDPKYRLRDRRLLIRRVVHAQDGEVLVDNTHHVHQPHDRHGDNPALLWSNGRLNTRHRLGSVHLRLL